MLERTAAHFASLAELGRDQAFPSGWDTAPCVEVVKAASAGLPNVGALSANDAARQAHKSGGRQRVVMRALEARLAPRWVARAAHERLRANGVDVSAPEVERAWQRIVPFPRRESGAVALASAKTFINAWTTSRRMHDVRALPCVFGCATDAG